MVVRCRLAIINPYLINTLRPRRNEQHFADDTFKRIFFNENVWISIKISLKFVSKGPINNIPALVQIMAWRRSGDKLLSEPMMVSLPMHICVTRPQWVDRVQYSKYHGCWCHGSLRREIISSNDAKYQVLVLHEEGFQLPVCVNVEQWHKM